MKTFKEYQPGQALLFPVDLNEWLPKGHPAHRAARITYEDPLTFAIAALERDGVEVTVRPRFDVNGEGAADLWNEFAVRGSLGAGDDGRHVAATGVPTRGPDASDGRMGASEGSAGLAAPEQGGGPIALEQARGRIAPSLPGEAIGGAVSAKTIVPSGEAREMVFVLAWDMPVARFGQGTAWYRRYTRFYGHDGQAAPALARDTVLRLEKWERAIEARQEPVLSDPRLPDWYKSLLFNETYYLVDGGTIWTAGTDAARPAAAADAGHSVPDPNTSQSTAARGAGGSTADPGIGDSRAAPDADDSTADPDDGRAHDRS